MATQNVISEYGLDLDQLRQTYGYYVDRANEVAQNYYAAVRDTWDSYLNLDLPAYDEMQVDVDMAAYKQFGGLNNTDMPGYTISQLSTGNNKAGLTFDNMWDKSVTRLNEQDFINLASQLVNHTARMAVEGNADHDPSQPRYARVPSGKYTCAFCVMLASRGWAYKSEESAGGGDHRYHTHCDCMIIPSWGKFKLKNYNPDVYYQQYKACAQTVSRFTTKEEYDKYVSTFTHQFAGQKPLRYERWKQNIELAEMRWRDKQWLNTGKLPEITFPSEKEKKEIESARPHEIRTAKRMQKFGIRPEFKFDYKPVRKENGIVDRKGQSDFAGGIEIKTIQHVLGKKTVDRYLGSASEKKDCKILIIDNADTNLNSDEAVIKGIIESNRFKRGIIYIISADEQLIRIR